VIIRVFRGRLRKGDETEFYRIVREDRLPAFRTRHAMLEAHVGRRHDPAGDLFMIVTVWPDYETLASWIGGDPDEPYRLGEIAGLLAEWQIEHFEDIAEPAAPRPEASSARR
jgi:hypothetical protein